MAMEDVLDGVRRIVHKWVDTSSPLISDMAVGDSIVPLRASRRFQVNDQVMLRDASVYETGLIIESIDDDTNEITLDSSVLNNWTVSQNAQLIKTINEQFIQGIYIGDPDVIPRYPAITVNGVSRSSEWLTIESTKERYEIEIGVFIQESTHEAGYRFLLNITDVIQKGLKRNIIPLINDYDIIPLVEDISEGDVTITIGDADKVQDYKRIIIEDEDNFQENWILNVYASENPSYGTVVHLADPMCCGFKAGQTSIVVPKRFIYNSWPATIEYGKIHKGELLKAAKISWFAEEEEMQFLRRGEHQLL